MDIARRTQSIVAGLRKHVADKLDRHTVDGLRWIELGLRWNASDNTRGAMSLVLPCQLKADIALSTLLLEVQLLGWVIVSFNRLKQPSETDIKMDWVFTPKATTPPTAELFPDLPREQQPLVAGYPLTTDLEVKREA